MRAVASSGGGTAGARADGEAPVGAGVAAGEVAVEADEAAVAVDEAVGVRVASDGVDDAADGVEERVPLEAGPLAGRQAVSDSRSGLSNPVSRSREITVILFSSHSLTHS